MSPIPRNHFVQADGDPELSLSFDDVSDPKRFLDILRRACNVLSLSNIEFFSLSSHGPNQVINWSEIFQHCTEVTTVKVSGRGTIGLFQALTPPEQANTTTRGKGQKRKRGSKGRGARAQAANDIDSHGPGLVHIPIFPKLTSLLLEMLYFSDVAPGSGALYGLVMSAVKRRKANKTPLTTLCIDNCVIREEQAKALKKVVRDFRWDHDEGYDESDCEDSSDYDDDDDEFGGWADDIRRQVLGWGGFHTDWEPEW